MATRLLAAGGALLAAFYLFAVSVELFGLRQLVAVGTGSGGIGAVSVGFPGTWTLALFGSAVANRAIARWARASADWIRRLHRLHTIMIVVEVAIVLILFVEVVGRLQSVTLGSNGLLVGGLILFGLVFLGQLAVIAVLLAVFTVGPRLTPNAA